MILFTVGDEDGGDEDGRQASEEDSSSISDDSDDTDYSKREALIKGLFATGYQKIVLFRGYTTSESDTEEKDAACKVNITV